MDVKPIAGFNALTTHHCITGCMRTIYDYHQHAISEDMLLGLGGGVGFIYWHTRGTIPFMGGRANFTKPGIEGLEKTTGRRTGVKVEISATTSAKKAQASMISMLDAGEPVMIMCDMGFLPYMDFDGEEYHFGGHAVVICGYDDKSDEVLVADRDGLHQVSLATVMKARGSTYKPFPPKYQWYQYDFSQKRQPIPDEIRQAIKEQVTGMLEPPISNMGVKGIRKGAERAQEWPDVMSEKDLRFTMFNTFIFIDATGGTGGGLFRYMFSRFLRESAQLLEIDQLNTLADDFQHIGDRWQCAAEIFKRGWDAKNPILALAETKGVMLDIADKELAAWSKLSDVL